MPISHYQMTRRIIISCLQLISWPAAGKHAVLEFYKWAYEPHVAPRVQMDRLSQTAARWFQPESLTSFRVAEHVLMDCVMDSGN